MGTIYANDAARLKLKKAIDASGIMDGHAHHNSGSSCPMPLIYAQVAEGAPIRLPRWAYKTREAAEKLVSISYKEGVRIQKLSTFDMGNHLAKLNKQTFANIVSSKDFANELAEKKGGARIATPMIIATMDMERAHIAGYEGQTIYHDESGKLLYYRRKSGALPETEGKVVDLSHEIVKNKIDKSKVLKMKKWRFQYDETRNSAKNNPLHLLPIYFYDPRRFGRPAGTPFPESKDYAAWNEIFNFIATNTRPGIWAGVKMYPSLGHKPFDELCEYLPEFYHHCEKDRIPILTHCSPGGMITHEAEFYAEFDDANENLRENCRIKQHEKLNVMRLENDKFIAEGEIDGGGDFPFPQPWIVHDRRLITYDSAANKLLCHDADLKPATHPLVDIFNRNSGKVRKLKGMIIHPTLPFGLVVEIGKDIDKTEIDKLPAGSDARSALLDKLWEIAEIHALYLLRWDTTDTNKQYIPIHTDALSLLAPLAVKQYSRFTFSPDGKWLVFGHEDMSQDERGNFYGGKEQPFFVALPVDERKPFFFGEPIFLGRTLIKERDVTTTAWATEPTSFVAADGLGLYKWDLGKLYTARTVTTPDALFPLE